MKPSIFIGSSSEALGLAKAIKSVLSKDYDAAIWNERLFELGEDTLNNLLLFIQCYDFAILVLTGDDLTNMRGKKSESPRDNVIFELGLFMGALGRRRAFPIIASGKDGSIKLPSDLSGNNAVYLKKRYAEGNASLSQLRSELTQLLETLEARSREAILQSLPSTALAIGYFQNFVRPVCLELVAQPSVTIDGKSIDISSGNFDFTIFLPKALSDASREGAQKFCKEQKVADFKLRSGARDYPFYVRAELRDGRVQFCDYPTTLRVSLDAVRMILARPTLGDGKYHELLDGREIRNFERTLGILLKDGSATQFRAHVKFAHV